MTASLDPARLPAFVARRWDEDIVPRLMDYIRIPNKSPHFDPRWKENGHMDAAVRLAESWCRAQDIAGLRVEVIELPGRTPVLLLEIPGEGSGTVLLYGHLDKQPEMSGWHAGLGPWTPVLNGDKLYGRGGADDGYAVFASLTAIAALRDAGLPHPRCVVLIECCEESGSYDLPHYVRALAGRIGQPALVICLDSGCGNYEQLWCTTSLRGLVNGTLRVEVLGEGVHSGDASGVVPSSFRIIRQLLDRIEEAESGLVRDAAFHAEIPSERLAQSRAAAAILGDAGYRKFPLVEGMRPASADPAELILKRTWRPALSITGADGLPPIADAGNVLRPFSALKLSLRLPPTVDAEAAAARLKTILETDPPYGAHVRFESDQAAGGWNAPAMAPWLARAVEQASRAYFGRDAAFMGEGGSIPFMGMLGSLFPQAQFLITGVLGPASNAHGPNEFLHLPTAKRLTCCVARILADFHAHSARRDPA